MEMISAVLGALAVFVAVFALATPVSRQRVHARLGRLQRETVLTEREQSLARPFFERVGMPSFNFARGSVRRLLPGTIADDIDRRLRRAGEPTTLHGFVLMQMVAAAIGLFIFVGGLALGLPGIMALLPLLVGVAICAIPFVWLDNAASNRRKALHRALPDAADLIVTMVEAGMSIDAALAKVAEETDGPLSDELTFTIRETTLGRARKDALLGLAQRADVPEIRSFVQSIIHAQATGVPLGQVLRTQANEIRLKKRQRAEESARKAPIKVLVVMILFIMPALILMLLGPAAIRASQQL